MIIFSKAQNNKKKDTKKWLFSFLSIYFLLSISFLILFCVFIITSEFFSLKKKSIYEKIFKRGRIEYIYTPKIFFESLKSNFIKLENLDIRISAERQLIIENERAKLIEFYNNYKLKPDLDHYEANVLLDANKNKDIRASISLKGFRAVHWTEKEKSSYSIKLKGDGTFLGMDEFDVNKPRARNYVHEWIFYKFAKSIGLAVPKYEFIKMSINGNRSNLYVAEEGMTNKLIERNKRRNGPIFKVTGEYTFKDSTVEVYNKRYWQRPENKDLYIFANTKMNDFKNGKISHEDFFDMDLWARYFAMTDVLSTHHGALIKSPKFYYNSLSGKFEPIPNDGHRHLANYWKYTYSTTTNEMTPAQIPNSGSGGSPSRYKLRESGTASAGAYAGYLSGGFYPAAPGQVSTSSKLDYSNESASLVPASNSPYAATYIVGMGRANDQSVYMAGGDNDGGVGRVSYVSKISHVTDTASNISPISLVTGVSPSSDSITSSSNSSTNFLTVDNDLLLPFQTPLASSITCLACSSIRKFFNVSETISALYSVLSLPMLSSMASIFCR